MKTKRRLVYAASIVSTIALGLASRRFPGLFPAAFGKYPGDALWALMIFCAWGFIIPESSTEKLVWYALVTSYLDEFSQIYQSAWINAIRSTPIGHLILGSTFSWLDMVAYTVGVSIGGASKEVIEKFLSKHLLSP